MIGMRSIISYHKAWSDLGIGFVLDNSELKKLILTEIHVKVYSGHPTYQKTLTTIKNLYHWLNLKKEWLSLFLDVWIINSES